MSNWFSHSILRQIVWWCVCAMLAVAIFLLVGCKTVPRIKSKVADVIGVADNGKPATLDSGETKQAVVIPAASPVAVTRIEAVPATETTPFQPAREVFSFTPAKETRWEAVSSTLRADTGVIDTTVATAKIEAEERRWLLLTAIGCAVVGVLAKSLLPAWPAIPNGLLLMAVIAGVTWKVSALPDWLFALGGAGWLLAAGYKRAELDKDKDGVPDFLQKK